MFLKTIPLKYLTVEVHFYKNLHTIDCTFSASIFHFLKGSIYDRVTTTMFGGQILHAEFILN